MALALLLLAALAPSARAEDTYARCDRNVSLASLDDGAQATLAAKGVYLDESRRDVPGSSYKMHYLFFTLPAAPASVMGVYTQFEKHPAVFRESVARSEPRGGDKVYIEERIPYPVPNPRFILVQKLTRLSSGGYRLDIGLDSYEDNSSHPSWYDSYLAALPHRDKTLVIFCKYVVPSNKSMPGVANNLVRDRMLDLPKKLGTWIRSELGDPAVQARIKTLAP